MSSSAHRTHWAVSGVIKDLAFLDYLAQEPVVLSQPALDLLSHVRFRWKLRPEQVTGDTVYGTVENIAALEQEHIRAYIPLADYESRTSLYGKQAFRYDPLQDVYICPNKQR